MQYRVPSEVELSVTALSVDPELRLANDSAVVSLRPHNRLGPPTRPEPLAELGARRSLVGRPDSTGAVPPYDIDVPPGTTTLRVTVRPEGASHADLDMYLFDCTTGDCFLWDHAIGHPRGGELVVRSPRPGAWKTVIDPVGGSSATAFRYTDVVTNPRYGMVRSLAPDSVRVMRTGTVPSGRELVLVADVVDQGLEMEEQARPLALFAAQPYRPVPLGTAIMSLTGDSAQAAAVRHR